MGDGGGPVVFGGHVGADAEVGSAEEIAGAVVFEVAGLAVGHGGGEFLDRLVEAAKAAQGVAVVVVEGGIGGALSDGGLEVGQGLLDLLVRDEDVGEVVL